MMEMTILCKRDEQEPNGERHRKTILHLLNKRPKRIRIMSLNFHDTELDGGRTLSQELKEMLVRHAVVTIIVGEDPEEMELKDIEFLQELMDFGANVYHHPRVHAKLFLLQGRNDEVEVVITSANFTPTGLHKNFELGCYFADMTLKHSKIVNNFFEYLLSLPARKSLEEWETIFRS